MTVKERGDELQHIPTAWVSRCMFLHSNDDMGSGASLLLHSAVFPLRIDILNKLRITGFLTMQHCKHALSSQGKPKSICQTNSFDNVPDLVCQDVPGAGSGKEWRPPSIDLNSRPGWPLQCKETIKRDVVLPKV